jgi:hypothetical protein
MRFVAKTEFAAHSTQGVSPDWLIRHRYHHRETFVPGVGKVRDVLILANSADVTAS